MLLLRKKYQTEYRIHNPLANINNTIQNVLSNVATQEQAPTEVEINYITMQIVREFIVKSPVVLFICMFFFELLRSLIFKGILGYWNFFCISWLLVLLWLLKTSITLPNPICIFFQIIFFIYIVHLLVFPFIIKKYIKYFHLYMTIIKICVTILSIFAAIMSIVDSIVIFRMNRQIIQMLGSSYVLSPVDINS
mgnify:CR=1 FL=1